MKIDSFSGNGTSGCFWFCPVENGYFDPPELSYTVNGSLVDFAVSINTQDYDCARFPRLYVEGKCIDPSDYVNTYDSNGCTHIIMDMSYFNVGLNEVKARTITYDEGYISSYYSGSVSVEKEDTVIVPVPNVIVNGELVAWSQSTLATSYEVMLNGLIIDVGLYGHFNWYHEIPNHGIYSVRVRGVCRTASNTYYSEWSSIVTFEASAPSVTRFEVIDDTLYYDVAGARVEGSLKLGNAVLNDNISSGSNTYTFTNISQGIYGISLTVNNKYGSITVGPIDYIVGAYEDDPNGIFIYITTTIEGIVDILKSVEFFGISLWFMLVTSFVITIIIPFLTIIILPSRGIGGYIPRGGNVESDRYKRSKIGFEADIGNGSDKDNNTPRDIGFK